MLETFPGTPDLIQWQFGVFVPPLPMQPLPAYFATAPANGDSVVWSAEPLGSGDDNDLESETALVVERLNAAGCRRVYYWPLRNERRQIELVASEVV